MSRHAAKLFVQSAQDAVSSRGRFIVALSGGSTPKSLYSLLSGPGYLSKVDWEKTDLFWGDERMVPPTDTRSNFRMAEETLLHKVSANIHRIRGEDEPEDAALACEDELRGTFMLERSGDIPRFDLVLLGVGDDGHTASLFPGSPSLLERNRLAVPVREKDPPRVTLSFPVLNNASSVVFLVAGEGKAEVVAHIIEENNTRGYPAGMVSPVRGKSIWLLDRAAASRLRHTGVEL